MAGAQCTMVLLIGAIIAPFVIRGLYRRAQQTGSIVIREAFTMLPHGHLQAGNAIFDPQTRTMQRIDGTRTVPFSTIAGVALQMSTSRKIYIQLLLENDEEYDLSTISNQDIKLAGTNGHLVAEVVAEQGDAFLTAMRQYEWDAHMLRNRFEYRF